MTERRDRGWRRPDPGPAHLRRVPPTAPTSTLPRTGLLTWDWRAQPDLDHLARLLTDLTDGQLHLRQVETGDDQYAIVLSTLPIPREQAHQLYDDHLEGR